MLASILYYYYFHHKRLYINRFFIIVKHRKLSGSKVMYFYMMEHSVAVGNNVTD